MNILIVFGTKTGTTENCAHKIKTEILDAIVDVVDVKNINNYDLKKYDSIVLGSSLYMGRINKRMRKFIKKNHSLLLEKHLHFFVCGMARGKDGIDLFEKQVDRDLVEHAKQIRQLGFELHYERMNPLYRVIMKKIIEESKPEIGLDEAEIIEFSKQVSKGSLI